MKTHESKHTPHLSGALRDVAVGLARNPTAQRIHEIADSVYALEVSHMDLLAALQNIESRLTRWRKMGIEAGTQGRDRDWSELCAQARAVIVQAGGDK